MFRQLTYMQKEALDHHVSFMVHAPFNWVKVRIKDGIVSWKVHVHVEPEPECHSGSVSIKQLNELIDKRDSNGIW